MMKKNNYYLVMILIGVFSYSCGVKKQKSCTISEVQTIFFDGLNEDYVHYVLIEDYDRKCMDSAKMVNLAKKYADTITQGKPALMIKFFNSDEAFIPNEVSQPMREIEKSGLVTISFNKEMVPTTFIFYNDNGDWVYRGSEWKPSK